MPKDYLNKHKKYVWAAGVVAVYAALGFFLAPWLIQKNLVGSLREDYGAELRLEKVEVNPFVLSLRLRGLELDDPAHAPVARIESIFINFQLSSLFRWAWTFDELRITAPEVFVARDHSGNLNVAYLFEETADQVAGTAANTEEADSSLMRMLVSTFVITDGAVNWHDEVPVDTVETRFGPIDIAIQDLNTLPDRSGQQTVKITTESAGTLSWTGSLQLNPLKSTAHASIKGSHFPLTSAYIRHETGFDIVEGNADVELDYTIDTKADGTMSAAVDNFNLGFNDVVVQTFSGSTAAGAKSENRQVLRLPEIRLQDGSLRWPEKSVTFGALTMSDALVSVYRDESGALNIDRASTDNGADADELDEMGDGGSAGDEWQFSLQRFVINRLVLDLEDHSVSPFADVGIASLDLTVADVSNRPGAIFPTSLDVTVRSGGTLKMQGAVSILPAVTLDLDLIVDHIELAGAHPYIKPLADVQLESGALSLNGHMTSSSSEPLSFEGDVEITDFEINETDEGSRLGSWQSLSARKLKLSIAENTLDISEIQLNQPYGDIVIANDGSLNLGRIEKSDSSPDLDTSVGSEDAGSKTQVDDESVGIPLAVTVGRVVLTQAAADFADFSLPLPFTVKIQELNGKLTTISTTSAEPSEVLLEGKVDEYGLVRVTGNVTPLDPSANTDLLVTFQNVLMPKFTAYTVPFAGREIASGSLDLSLGYQVTDSQLVGENSIILRDFELGEKVPHPGATSLPLGLAVALLKDSEGKIDIDLPVRGDLDDPEFSYGGVIWKALGNLIVKIVASPFTLLGKLIGVEADELEYINFLDGRSDLTPPELQKAAKLAEALSLRPELTLEVPGVVDREADGLALRKAELELVIEERVTTLASSADNDDMYAEQRLIVLEQLFKEQQAAEDPAGVLQELRARFSAETESDDERGVTVQFDELAYSNELQRQLIELQPITEADLVSLAVARRENTRLAILANDDSLQDRIIPGEITAATTGAEGTINMKVSLAARKQ